MKIFFDLDGTLLDSSDRLYNLFCYLIPECKFSKNEYWELKRNKINHQMILEKYFPQYLFEEFNRNWLNLIESDAYLKFDKLYPMTETILTELAAKKNEIYLITARQSRQKVLGELERHNIKRFFSQIYVTENKTTKDLILKELKLDNRSVMIGDTGLDIICAKNNNLRSISVTYGFMNKEKLSEYNPDFIADNQYDLLEVLTKLKEED